MSSTSSTSSYSPSPSLSSIGLSPNLTHSHTHLSPKSSSSSISSLSSLAVSDAPHPPPSFSSLVDPVQNGSNGKTIHSKTSAFFDSPFSSPWATSPPTPEPPKSIHLSPKSPKFELSRIFPARNNSISSLALPSPPSTASSPRKSAFPPTTVISPVSATFNDTASVTLDQQTPKPHIHTPSFVVSSEPASHLVPTSKPSLSSLSTTTTEDNESQLGNNVVSDAPTTLIAPGSIVHPTDSQPASIRIKLLQTLGQGAFSDVWLGEDVSGEPLIPLVRSLSQKKRRFLGVRGGVVRGTKPFVCSDNGGDGSGYLDSEVGRAGDGGGVRGGAGRKHLKQGGTLVAVKMTPRVDGEDRTRVSFVREVEILKHISHPYITLVLGSFTTPTHHALVLPYLPGGDLLALVNSDELHAQLSEKILRVMWCQLCSAVGWMHSVGLVHRDIKLENILLTTPFPPSPSSIATHPTRPLIALTDFGLSRFIDLASPHLTTRCGSEAYAAPELVMRGARYDARETDAWACGVVLFGLVGRCLPFDDSAKGGGATGTGRGMGEGNGGIGREGEAGKVERRSWLMRIAHGAWTWPALPPSSSHPASSPSSSFPPGEEGENEPCGASLPRSEGAKRIVERLLVRNPTRRAKIKELWDDEWMWGALSLSSCLASTSASTSQASSGLPTTTTSSIIDASSGLSSSGKHISGLPNHTHTRSSSLIASPLASHPSILLAHSNTNTDTDETRSPSQTNTPTISSPAPHNHDPQPYTPHTYTPHPCPVSVSELHLEEAQVVQELRDDEEIPDDRGVLVDREGIDGIACMEIV